MKNKLYLFVIVLSATLLTSCDSMEKDVDVPASQPKLVVYSYISPDEDSVKVWVTQSVPLYTTHPLFSNQYPPISDASVTISDGTQSYPLQFSAAIGQYFTTDFQPQSGATYSLEVSTSRNQKVTARCTVPTQAPPTVEMVSIEWEHSYGYVRAVTFKIKDGEGSGNYYRVVASVKYSYFGTDEGFYNTIYFDKGEEFISDNAKDGSYFTYQTEAILPDPSATIKLKISISAIDEHYFNYHRSINAYQDDNPFSEPTPVYSNINGGLGVFATYRNSITEIDLGR